MKNELLKAAKEMLRALSEMYYEPLDTGCKVGKAEDNLRWAIRAFEMEEALLSISREQIRHVLVDEGIDLAGLHEKMKQRILSTRNGE
jgi:superfamily I DNA/RNA helicase